METQNAQAFRVPRAAQAYESLFSPRKSCSTRSTTLSPGFLDEEVLILLVQLNLGSATSASGVTVAPASPTLQFQPTTDLKVWETQLQCPPRMSGGRGPPHGSCGSCIQFLSRVNRRRTESWDLAGLTGQVPYPPGGR